MFTKFTDLHCKEVICVNDGRRLGFISDACVEIPTGNIVSIVVPGPCRFFGLFGRECDFVIPWPAIRKIGSDIILVEISCEKVRRPRNKRNFWKNPKNK